MKTASLLVIGVMLLGPVLEAQANPICHTTTSRHYIPTRNVYHHEDVVRVVKVKAHDEFFYSNRDYLRDQAILEAIQALREAKSGVVPTQNKEVREEKPAVSTEVDAFLRGLPLPDSDGPVGSTGTGIDAEMVKLVKANCLSCHNKKIGHVDLSDLTKLSFDDRLAVNNYVVEGDMPPKGKLPNAQIQTVKNWFKTHKSEK